MKKRAFCILAALLMFVTLFPPGTYAEEAQTSEIVITPTFGQMDARSMLDMINAFRTGDEAFCWDENDAEQVSYKSEPLVYSYALEEIAMQRAAEVALSFSHTRPDNTRCFSATASDGTRSWGENIAAGSSTASGAFKQWREDNETYAGQGHRRNMLSGSFRAVGIGHVYFNGYHYWVQEFSYDTDSVPATAALDTERAISINVSEARLASAGNVTVSADSVTLSVGERAALPTVSASVQVSEAWPSKETTVSVKPVWTSGDASVCAVDGQEVVGVAAGSAIITGAALGKSVSVAVTVGGGSGGSGGGSGSGGGNGGVYAILYEDGTLVFQYGDTPESGKTVTKTYEVDLNNNYSYTSYAPWYNERESIRVASFADKVSPISTAYYFYNCSNLERVDNIQNLDTANVTNMSAMFSGCAVLSTLDVSGFNTSKVTDMSSMFSECGELEKLDVSGWDTSNVTNLSGIFSGCSWLTTLDVSGWDTSNVTSMFFTFSACDRLTELDVSGWNTSKVTNMCAMFQRCSSLAVLDVSGWDTSNVTNISWMFSRCGRVTVLDVSHFNVSNSKDLSYMFASCEGLKSLDVSSFDTSNATNMREMFNGCKRLTTLDVSNFDTSNVTDMRGMFANTSKLKTIYVSGKFTTAAVTESADMFINSTSLVGGAGTKYDESRVDATYARIDAEETPGYFSAIWKITAAELDTFGNLSVTLINPNAAVMAVSYFDASGRFVSANLQSVGSNAGTATGFVPANAKAARVMLLDSDSRPLCAAYPVTL